LFIDGGLQRRGLLDAMGARYGFVRRPQDVRFFRPGVLDFRRVGAAKNAIKDGGRSRLDQKGTFDGVG